MNNLRRIIFEEEKRAKDAYIKELAGKVINNEGDGLEEIFIKSLQEHIVIFRNYLDKIKHEFEVSKQQLQDKEQADRQYNEIKSYIFKALNQHMNTVVPQPNMLDIPCHIFLPQKNILLQNVSIKPYNNTETFKEIILEELQRRQHTIQYKNDSLGHIVIITPDKKLMYQDLVNLKGNIASAQDLEAYIGNIKNLGLEYIRLEPGKMITNYKITPYSTLVYIGEYEFKEDQPLECITHNYIAGQIVNYFSCEDCNSNWICQPCAAYCHKGHALVMHISNKKTTWACCYCVKNNLCKAINKDSKKV